MFLPRHQQRMVASIIPILLNFRKTNLEDSKGFSQNEAKQEPHSAEADKPSLTPKLSPFKSQLINSCLEMRQKQYD